MTDVANNNTNLMMEHKMRRSSSVLSSIGNSIYIYTLLFFNNKKIYTNMQFIIFYINI